jgi:hypothetical protein
MFPFLGPTLSPGGIAGASFPPRLSLSCLSLLSIITFPFFSSLLERWVSGSVSCWLFCWELTSSANSLRTSWVLDTLLPLGNPSSGLLRLF